MDITNAIKYLCPNAEFSVVGETYEGIEWFSPNIPMPTKQELEAVMPEVEKQIANQQADYNRHKAYVAESDPLFFKAQRGEGSMAEWEAKVAEIKARYPKV